MLTIVPLRTALLQVEALVSHVVGSELDGGPAALLRGWAGLSVDAMRVVQDGSGAANAILIFMTGAEEINRTVLAPHVVKAYAAQQITLNQSLVQFTVMCIVDTIGTHQGAEAVLLYRASTRYSQ